MPLVWALISFPAAAANATEPMLYPLPAATHAGELTSAADGALWFAGNHGAEHIGGEDIFVGRWDPVGGLSEFTLPSGRYIGKPAVGTEGEAWLPGSAPNGKGRLVGRLGRLSTSGQLYDYPLGNHVGSVRSVAALNGTVWFTASRRVNGKPHATIGHIAAAGDGSVQQLSLPPGCGVAALAAAANVVWFTESCWRKHSARGSHRASIGRIDPAGGITRYPISPRFKAISLAPTSDDSVWFGEAGARGFHPRIGHLTPSGRVAEFDVPDGRPQAIAVGPEGRLWFPSTTGGSAIRALASIGPAGDIGQPICLNPQCTLEPTGLTTGPDGTVWFSAAKARSGGGGGGTVIAETILIANEAGFIGRLSG